MIKKTATLGYVSGNILYDTSLRAIGQLSPQHISVRGWKGHDCEICLEGNKIVSVRVLK